MTEGKKKMCYCEQFRMPVEGEEGSWMKVRLYRGLVNFRRS